MRNRLNRLAIHATLIAFAASIYGMKFVEQQFFPNSDRPELIVDWNLPQNASIHDTDAQMARFETEMIQNSHPQLKASRKPMKAAELRGDRRCSSARTQREKR